MAIGCHPSVRHLCQVASGIKDVLDTLIAGSGCKGECFPAGGFQSVDGILVGQFQKSHTTAVRLLFYTFGGKDRIYCLIGTGTDPLLSLIHIYAQQLNVDFLSTPFDFESSDYLDSFMPMYKISSSDVTNLPFIEHISKKDKPIILSVGASNEDEIIRAVDAIRNNNNQPLILLHCVLEYPTPYEHANLLKIKTLVEKFPNCIIGYSDHTKPDVHKDVIKAAYLMGAKVIEKHFTLDKTLKGNDHYHAMDPSDIVEIKQGLDFIKQLEGNRELVCLDSETAARINARRSIVTKQDIPQGTVITREMITFKRPGLGISPSQIEEVIGKTAAVDLDEDTIMKEEMIN